MSEITKVKEMQKAGLRTAIEKLKECDDNHEAYGIIVAIGSNLRTYKDISSDHLALRLESTRAQLLADAAHDFNKSVIAILISEIEVYMNAMEDAE